MRRLFVTLILGCGITVGLLAGVPNAKALPPLSKETKTVPASFDRGASAVYKHGMPIMVVLTDTTKLTGRVVLANDAEDYLLIRTAPGTLPKKIMGGDIAAIYPVQAAEQPASGGNGIRPANLQGPGNGGIQFAIPGQTAPQTSSDTTPSEISTVEIWNGPVRTVHYVAPNLSSTEKELLNRLEAAENKLGEMAELNVLRQQFVTDAQRLDRARTRGLINYYTEGPLQYGVTLSGGSGYAGGYGGFGYGGYGLGQFGYGGGYGGGYGIGRAGSAIYSTVPMLVPNPTQFETPGQAMKVAAAQAMAKDMTPESLAAAQEEVAALRSKAIFNPNGQLVAVLAEPQMIRSAASNRPAQGDVRPAVGNPDSTPPKKK